MELYERIRELRKNHLHMSQTDFGKRLGVSLSVINNIENNRLAKPEQKLSLLKLICKEFSVNEEWLMNGTEPMFVEPETFNLHDFAKEHNITKLETEIVKAYLELDSGVRKMLIEHFKDYLRGQLADESEREPTVEELEAEYKKSRLDSARKTGSSVMNTTGGAAAKNEKASGA